MPDNHLYYGDNLDIMRRYIRDETVDLVYLDPPFNSNASYNVLFHERDGSRAAAQIQAFEDTWEWNLESEHAWREIVERGGRVSQAMQAFRQLLGDNDMLAYLAMMAPRLVELHRVLKPTGSLYLHCDPTASHYLKLLLDAIFGPRNYRSEIVWKRTAAHNDTKQGRTNYGHIHDIILYYAKSDVSTWNPQYTPYSQEYIDEFYRYTEEGTGRRYRMGDLTAAKPGGDTDYEWKGAKPYKGRYWAYSKANMEKFDAEGRLVYTKSGVPNYKRYLDEMPGVSLQDQWTDIRPIGPKAAEKLGYPTQKPEALLERIISVSSNPGDVVLDSFCGCGTAIIAAQKLGRRWIGIDVTHVAVGLMKTRLRDTFGPDMVPGKGYTVTGEPTTLPDAAKLAEEDKFQFQAWALGLVGARLAEVKKGADKGIDGRLYFHAGDATTRQVIFSVKGGHLKADDIRALGHVVTREGADIGVLISLEEPTSGMRADAASAGFYRSPWRDHPRLQLLTIHELLDGKRVDMPYTAGTNLTFKQAPKAATVTAGQLSLLDGDEDE